MAFGKMRQIIKIVATVPKKDSAGFVTKTDEVIATTRAYAEQRYASEKWFNRAAFSTATILFKFRVIPNVVIDTSHTIIWGDTRYNITSVENVRSKNMYLEVLAEKVEPSKS